ncbi:MAG: YIP1 family protein [Paenibacillaceae bacterium]|uniref:YIP1 family protein n=1 Tax=Paenibacillus mellifer TaxID=2937794 RepID=A0A9X1Y1U7_9BACL|nr:Yip1 family protein [Paenibacillus mellifer]MBW4837774.1 YIP1 family protein [Paenibacillaceae bacterium]MCK8488956.1 YIP1 family protein [Paenibacillus mellifer]
MKNVLTIFTAPEETFKRVRESKTAWLFALAVLLVVSIVVIYMQMPTLEKEFQRQFQNQQIDAGMQQTFMATAKTTAYVMGAIVPVIMLFVTGLLLMLLNLVVRGEGKYMQFVSIAAFAALPGIVGSLITGIMIMTMDVQSQTDVSLSLGAFVTDKSSQMYQLLSLINPFSIWSLVLYIIGSSVIMNRPRKTVATWIIAAWLVISLGSLLLS